MHPQTELNSPASVPALLVIERQRFQRRALCRLLRAAGADKVVDAVDIHAATCQIAEQEPSAWIVVADPDALGTDGVRALASLRAGAYDMAFLLLSKRRGEDLELLHTVAQQHGINLVAALRKPVSVEEIGTLFSRLPSSTGAGPRNRAHVLSKDELGECLRVGRIKARFQPIVDLSSGRPVSCEALPFVTHLRYGDLPPPSFARALAQLGAQRVMTASVMRDAANFVLTLREKGLGATVAVNVTPEVLSESGDAASLDAYVRALGVTPTDICLEISESPGSHSPVHFSDNLARLKLRGYALAMDATPGPTHIDQPTHAYCSEIKLGHALVSKLHTDSEIAKMVASVVRSAHRCGMSTCALELETIADLDQARALGIDLGQGAVFSDSLPAEETLAWVEREERVRSFKSVARARERVG